MAVAREAYQKATTVISHVLNDGEVDHFMVSTASKRAFCYTMYVLKPLPLRMFTSLRIFSKPAPLFIVRFQKREFRLIHANAISCVE